MTITPSSPADRYRHLSGRFSSLIDSVPADRWASASPCEGWTAADVADHVVTTEAELLGRMPFAPSHPIDMTEPLAAWPTVRAAMQSALDVPEHADHTYDGYFGRTTFAATVDLFYNFDLVAHTWDLARAAGLAQFEAIDPDEAGRIERDLAPLGDKIRMQGILGQALQVADDADPSTRFLAFLGRRA